jgi:hypothetical protein
LRTADLRIGLLILCDGIFDAYKIKDAYMETFFLGSNLCRRPVMRPYAASSKAIATAVGNIGGIPSSMHLKTGKTRPLIKPYGHPQINPQSKTGICIGNNLLPRLGICAVRNGIKSTNARNNPDNTNCLVDSFFIFFPHKIKYHEDLNLHGY